MNQKHVARCPRCKSYQVKLLGCFDRTALKTNIRSQYCFKLYRCIRCKVQFFTDKNHNRN